ncbi:hypothetical protein VSK91_15860 [Bacillus swezeyi]|uniref:hypothetical protein n=1 Tax=Bacillus swezeyi TaxID=1925020 RepID=UPI0039C66A42
MIRAPRLKGGLIVKKPVATGLNGLLGIKLPVLSTAITNASKAAEAQHAVTKKEQTARLLYSLIYQRTVLMSPII